MKNFIKWKIAAPLAAVPILALGVILIAVISSLAVPLASADNPNRPGANEILGLSGIDGFVSPLPEIDITEHITSYYGTRTLNGETKVHYAIDISYGGIYGTPIVAVADGIVEFVGSLENGKFMANGYGNYVTLNHTAENGEHIIKTRYGHMSAVVAKEGRDVKQGEVIGYVGSTGFSTGPHLHFEMWVDGARVDPLLFPYAWQEEAEVLQ